MTARRWIAGLLRALRALSGPRHARRAQATTGRRTTPPPPRHGAPPTRHDSLPDFTGTVRALYAPARDGSADPGEIVWTWVAYEDDPTRGKDRPVLVIGRAGTSVLGLMLTSKDHSHDVEREARRGRRWLDIGSGPWDTQHRPSAVRLDRIVRLDPDAIRREGAVITRPEFARIIAAL